MVDTEALNEHWRPWHSQTRWLNVAKNRNSPSEIPRNNRFGAGKGKGAELKVHAAWWLTVFTLFSLSLSLCERTLKNVFQRLKFFLINYKQPASRQDLKTGKLANWKWNMKNRGTIVQHLWKNGGFRGDAPSSPQLLSPRLRKADRNICNNATRGPLINLSPLTI